MPKRRRRTFSTPRKRRGRVDWVYRPNAPTIGTGTIGNDNLGTYEYATRTLSTGVANANTLVLYDSANWFADMTRGSVGLGSIVGGMGGLGRQARASGRKPIIRAVEGVIICQPTTWALGSQMGLGVRCGVYQQSMEGPAQLDLQESMFIDNNVFPREQISWYANSVRKNVWERRYYKAFGDASTTPSIVMKVRFRCRKFLDDNEGFFLYLESPGSGIMSSVNVRYVTFLRTLVESDA